MPGEQPMIYSISRIAVAFIWFYHGLVPKILFQSPIELELLSKGPIEFTNPELVTSIIGYLEIAFALSMLLLWAKRWPMMVSALGMVILLLGTLFYWPSLLMEAFNPLTINLAVISLSIINLVSMKVDSDLD